MKRINWVFLGFIFILCFIIIFVDNEVLNSLLVHQDNIKVDEVAVLDNHYSKVIYNESIIASVRKSVDDNQVSNANVVSRWVWPTEGNYSITTYYSSSHRAVDISNGYGSNIYAANSGVVSMVMGGCRAGNLSCNGKGGNYVVINHNNGYYTVYMHLKSISVSTGQTVNSGQVIGKMGNTGNVIPVPTSVHPYLGTHLHFCLYKGEPFKGGVAVNPMTLY